MHISQDPKSQQLIIVITSNYIIYTCIDIILLLCKAIKRMALQAIKTEVMNVLAVQNPCDKCDWNKNDY